MPVQRLRRLDAPAALSLYDRLTMDALSCAYSRAECDALEREHPNLIVQREASVMGAISHGDAIVFPYAFESTSDFQDHFEPLFEKLLPRARKAYSASTVCFRLTHGSSRPGVEATLRRLAFDARRSWFQFSLAKGAPSPKIAVPKGVIINEGSVADLDELVSIDHEAFPNTPMTRDGMAGKIKGGARIWVARQKGRAVGLALYDHREAGQGYLGTLAVRQEARGLGIGGALTLRTAKTVFAEGASRLDLRTDDDNGAAIRLYNYLGFKHIGSGRDYERPADPKVVDRMRKQSEGTFIKFGGWR